MSKIPGCMELPKDVRKMILAYLSDLDRKLLYYSVGIKTKIVYMQLPFTLEMTKWYYSIGGFIPRLAKRFAEKQGNLELLAFIETIEC